MKPRALFLSNEIYFDPSKKEGGVRLCTEEYLDLIKLLYDVELFTVSCHLSLAYRLRVKFGLNIYNDYKPEKYAAQLEAIIRKRDIQIVFLNLSNTAPFAATIKRVFGDKVKIILCSHGNESGDFLHEATRFKETTSFFRTWFSAYSLGSMLKKEAKFRQDDLDAVLTVSPVEEALEKWIGAKKVFMVPRTVKTQFITRKPVAGRVAFIGDLSHAPNFFGINEVCKAIAALSATEGINIRLVGAPSSVGESLAKNYPFVTYLGYMSNEELQKEAESWTYFLNPVFYYSRGVSTKLAKAFGWGLPVITTSIGCRGYTWTRGSMIVAESPKEMANAILVYSKNTTSIEEAGITIKELIQSIPTLEDNAVLLEQFIDQLT